MEIEKLKKEDFAQALELLSELENAKYYFVKEDDNKTLEISKIFEADGRVKIQQIEHNGNFGESIVLPLKGIKGAKLIIQVSEDDLFD